jgi:DNA-directed RNA polymerase specialized sigma24 family protein
MWLLIHSHSFKSNSHFRTWLTSIAQREYLRQKGQHEAHQAISFSGSMGDVEDGERARGPTVTLDGKQFVDAEKGRRILSSLDPILPLKSRRVVKAVATRGATIQDTPRC